jgi:uncharacterized protein
MTGVFADSSALVKLYSDEPGSKLVQSISPLIVCQLARVEVPAALWRKHRMNELSAEDTSVLIAAFEADYFGTVDDPGGFLVIATTAGILDDAAQLVAAHGLRAYDAVQLASARASRREVPEGIDFAAYDTALRAAAAREGFRLVPAEHA